MVEVSGSLIVCESEEQIFKTEINQITNYRIVNQAVVYSDSENEGKALTKLALMKEILRLEKEVETTKETLNKTKELLTEFR